jgi:hypothetical protein
VTGDDGRTAESAEARPEAPIDPRAIRVGVAPTSRLPSDPTITVGPSSVTLEPLRDKLAGVGLLGGVAAIPSAGDSAGPVEPELPLVDGTPTAVRLEWLDDRRAVLVRGEGSEATRTPVLIGPVWDRGGTSIREVVVDGWRLDLELESERRAALRERSRRGTEAARHSGPLEIHAIIPGRIVAVSVEKGEEVTAGQVLLVLEAMKMQNELHAPREGTIDRVAVTVGVDVEVGDLLMVIT